MQYYIEYLDLMMKRKPKDKRMHEWEARMKFIEQSHPESTTVGGQKVFGKPSTGMSMVYALKDMCKVRCSARTKRNIPNHGNQHAIV